MIHLALWGAITLCCIVWCCCGLISCSSSPQFRAAYLSEPVNKIIINQRCKGKRFVSVKYDTRWGGVSWQVAIFEPLIWSLCGSGNSQHSSRTITSRCKDLIQQILGGSFQLAPGPPSPLTPPRPPPPPPLPPPPPHSSPRCLSSGPAWNRCPWRKKKKKENTTALTCDWGPWQKAEALPENLKVMNHVVYYNNWNGSKWKHSPEYSRR